jgi:hypothetical protein
MSSVEVKDAPSTITFQRQAVQPPSDLYMTRMDALYITSYNSAAGITVHVRYTFLRVDGVVIVGSLDTHVPNTDRSAGTTVQALGEGYLLSVSAFLGSGSAKRGQCYVQVGVARGVGAARLVHRIIMQGYVGTAVNMSWPGARLEQPEEGPGFVRGITGTDPAAGVEVNETVPTGARWRLHSLHVSLVTSVTVANRYVQLRAYTGAQYVWLASVHQVQIASLTYEYTWAAGLAWLAPAALTYFNLPLPHFLVLGAGYQFLTVTSGLQAGDNFGAPDYQVEEWISP